MQKKRLEKKVLQFVQFQKPKKNPFEFLLNVTKRNNYFFCQFEFGFLREINLKTFLCKQLQIAFFREIKMMK